MVIVPHSNYVRWSLTVARLNTEAGEDIRYLARDKAREPELPDEDFWLLDSWRARSSALTMPIGSWAPNWLKIAPRWHCNRS